MRRGRVGGDLVTHQTVGDGGVVADVSLKLESVEWRRRKDPVHGESQQESGSDDEHSNTHPSRTVAIATDVADPDSREDGSDLTQRQQQS